MFSSKKIWWMVAILFLLLYIPGKGHAKPPTDIYGYTIIKGKISLEYDYKKKGDEPSHTGTFTQEYHLDITGNLLNRLLIIYDAGIEYHREDTAYASSRNSSSFHSYYFRTTILPKSTIPLTLHGRRSVSNTTSTTSTNTYGLWWSGFFQSLPRTRFGVTNTDTKGDNIKTTRTRYDLRLTKSTARTHNELNTNLTQRKDRLTSDEDTNSAINFHNKTNISRSTSVDVSYARGVSKGDGTPKMTVEGVSASIYSKPDAGVKQRHYYSYFENENIDGIDTSEDYSGMLDYDFSDRLTSNVKIEVLREDSDKLTIKRETELTRTMGELRYQASNKLSLYEKIEYEMQDVYGSTAGLTNQVDYTRLNVYSGAAYHTKLSWADMHSSYSAGYLESSSTDSSALGETEGKALDQQFSLDLSKMDAMGYAVVNTRGEYSYSTAFEGNLDSTVTRLNIFANNTVWRNYVRLSGSYDRSEVSSNISARNEFIETLRFVGQTLYLTKYLNKKDNGKTKLTLTADRIKKANDTNLRYGNTLTTKDLHLNHDRVLFRGLLNASVQSIDTESEYGNSVSSTLQHKFRVDYTRPLLRRISWKATGTHTRHTVNKTKTNMTSIINTLRYRLRRWAFSAEHRYNAHTISKSKTTEHRWLLKASRGFMRVI